MNRPTIALACIMKNEIAHIERMLKSVEGCFDHIYLTDTGSTDGTIEFVTSGQAEKTAGCPVTLKHFAWVDDFAAARNHSMDGVKEEYVMWLDLDDGLSDKAAFKMWRDEVLVLSDFWLAPYNYAFDDKGRPVCTFLRERVIRTTKKFRWEYFIHEGMIAQEPVQAMLASNWTVQHCRTLKDYEIDFSRNVTILEKRSKVEELPPRLKFYYGKELCDKGRFSEGYVWLDQVSDHPKLEGHDRILTFEYLVRACLHRYYSEQEHLPEHKRDATLLAKGLSLSCQGMSLAPNRAEFYCLAADCLVKMGRETEALPLYGAAIQCKKPQGQGVGFLYINHTAYEHIPRDMMARIYFKLGDLETALNFANDSVKLFNNDESKKLLGELLNLKMKVDESKTTEKVKCDDVVFTCMPGSHPYPFDEELYKTKGFGGSETAIVEVARHVKKITGRNVIVFNTRESEKVCESGVIYKPAQLMYDYFSKNIPKVHYAWRHAVKLTDAPTFVWCHDLMTPGAENHQNYHMILALSDFHKNFLQVVQNIPPEKILVTSNGVNKERFDVPAVKNENKIVWPSSPDRGLERAIDIIEIARAKSGRELELHVYYGLENLLRTPGLEEKGQKLIDLVKSKPWIKYHGNVDQTTLAREMKEAVIWLYPANFIETYCITAIEAMYAGCFAIARELGALKNTLKPFADRGFAKLLFLDANTKEEKEIWATQVLYALDSRAWEKIDMTEFDYSWKLVAYHFIDFGGLRGAMIKQIEAEAQELGL
jgi:glycosyltransferase involved in cell wall biosynthesis